MLFSQREAIPQEFCAIQIQGAPFYDIIYIYTEPRDARLQFARICGQLIHTNPGPGDRVFIEKIAIVTRVEKL